MNNKNVEQIPSQTALFVAFCLRIAGEMIKDEESKCISPLTM